MHDNKDITNKEFITKRLEKGKLPPLVVLIITDYHVISYTTKLNKCIIQNKMLLDGVTNMCTASDLLSIVSKSLYNLSIINDIDTDLVFDIYKSNTLFRR